MTDKEIAHALSSQKPINVTLCADGCFLTFEGRQQLITSDQAVAVFAALGQMMRPNGQSGERE